MKIIFIICLSFLLFSCFNKSREIDQLNQRITRLEKKIDSLTSGRNVTSFGLNDKSNQDPVSYGTTQASWRCQAITRKGTQCKRVAKNNGYCWQHKL